MAGGLVSWRSTLQSTIVLSSTEPEYMAVTEAVKKAIWLQGLVTDLGFKQQEVTVYCESQSTIHLAKNQTGRNAQHSEGCYLDKHYFVNCTNDSSSKTLRPTYLNCYLLNISLDGHLEYTWPGPVFICYNESVSPIYSHNSNVFVAVGCDTIAFFNGTWDNRIFSRGCISLCQDINDVVNGSCSGIGCCQLDIPNKLIDNLILEVRSFTRHKEVWKFNPCSYAFVAKKDAFSFSTKDLHSLDQLSKMKFPVVTDWGIQDETCESARAKSNIVCGGNSTCYDMDPVNGFVQYHCRCNHGYGGNPYLAAGCQDINECHDPRDNCCTQRCKNTMGNYTCSCTKWYRGDGRKDGTVELDVQVCVGIGTTLLMLLVGSFWVCWGLQRRNLIKLKGKFFQQNGLMEPIRIFKAKELEKATNNYDKSRILGQGGNGTVYRGVLLENKVFINEVIMLTQTNHRNVVNLLGCCLEIEVPLLVYEFITNGTLSDHLHDKNKSYLLSWEKHLKIATKAAGALAYLHFETSIPIIHRDVKIANILLDDNHTAKVADFGASRLIPLDHTRLTMLVQGIFGYLDPEYLRSGQLTEKKLLTHEKAISLDRIESEKNLSTYFISALKDNRLLEIIEGHIIKEGNVEEVKEVSYIAKMCLSIKGEDRPIMKVVAMELEGLRIMEKHSHGKADLYREETEYNSSVLKTTSFSAQHHGSSIATHHR
ncbi:hypothetical protein I3843_16G021700 [Carya illinoinensis]|nr:hypothetical protein I3843_16G021700 [Carya illinoinensis]